MPVVFAVVLTVFWGESVSAAELGPDDVPPAADVVLLGELHDNPFHHANQARWVVSIAPAALVFEMLPPALALRAQSHGPAPGLGEALDWEARGWPDFSMYRPIFAAAADAAIFGGEVAGDDARRAVIDGAAAVMGPAGDVFGLGVGLPPDEAAARAEAQGGSHCGALPPEMLPGMVEAQRLRDAALARAVVAAIAETGGPVVVITGNGHARRDWGVPAALAIAAPDLTVTSVGQFEASPPGDPPFDAWAVSPASSRGDPCDAFR